MDMTLLPALVAFAFVTSVTPGPNNLMLMASGANFGLRRTLPHMLGVALGFVVMAALVGLGLVQVFAALPWLFTLLKIGCVLYLLLLAWKIANAAAPEGGAGAGRPMTFLQAAAFQWVNPKAWAMALTAVTVYAPGQTVAAVLTVAAVFGAVNLPSVGSWAWLGVQMRRVLTSPARLRAFNLTMAALLVASLYPLLGSPAM
ncbi:LysE family translocator [Palleronia sp. KMU-117]|uniref:LysE family translocator n=1 Tax=Palleronia sp. KMU-117 TaxID=3434108 RepID=UPI003D715725